MGPSAGFIEPLRLSHQFFNRRNTFFLFAISCKFLRPAHRYVIQNARALRLLSVVREVFARLLDKQAGAVIERIER